MKLYCDKAEYDREPVQILLYYIYFQFQSTELINYKTIPYFLTCRV